MSVKECLQLVTCSHRFASQHAVGFERTFSRYRSKMQLRLTSFTHINVSTCSQHAANMQPTCSCMFSALTANQSRRRNAHNMHTTCRRVLNRFLRQPTCSQHAVNMQPTCSQHAAECFLRENEASKRQRAGVKLHTACSPC